jgi:hypothetical protein
MPTLADALRGYTPPTTSALADPIVEHFRNLPQTTAQNAINMNNMVQNAMPYNFDPRSNGVNPSYDPQASKDFANYIPNLMGATAYHGTPHNILGKFDVNKIRTGEGSNAYGAGMYFAENPAVAEMYQAKFAMPKLKALEPTLENTAMRYNFYDPSESATLKFLKTKFSNAPQTEIDEAVKKGKSEYKNFISKHANLYKVDIPDEKIATMLDINSSLENQPENVKKFVEKHIDELTADMHRYKPQSQDSSIWNRMNGSDLMAWAAEKTGNYDLGNQLFAKNNILGMKYLDEGSRAKGKGTSNFVVFDPSDVKILEKNNQPVSRKELIKQKIDNLE